MMENSSHIDRISNLADELLCQILSSLPTKLTFSTIILSKRWATPYKLLTALRFDDEFVDDEEAFLRYRAFVDALMLSTHCIKTFHLRCGSRHWQERCRFNNIENWIETLKQHTVENIQISSRIERPMWIILPPGFFRFSTLIVLKLFRVKVVDNISVDLPLLKTLHLASVHFKNKENFNKLLNGCPILEDLDVYLHYIESSEKGVTVSTGDIKILSKLIRAKINDSDVPFRAIPNVEVLKLRIVREMPEPESNSYFSGFLECQNLIHLEIRFFLFHQWDMIVVVLQNCPKLQILAIEKSWEVSKDLFSPNFVPECISFHLRSCTLYCNGYSDECQFVTYILHNAPLLGVMKIVIIDKVSALPNEDALEELTLCPRISPNCKLSIGLC